MNGTLQAALWLGSFMYGVRQCMTVPAEMTAIWRFIEPQPCDYPFEEGDEGVWNQPGMFALTDDGPVRVSAAPEDDSGFHARHLFGFGGVLRPGLLSD